MKLADQRRGDPVAVAGVIAWVIGLLRVVLRARIAADVTVVLDIVAVTDLVD